MMRRGKEEVRDAQAPRPKGLLGFVVLWTRVRFDSVFIRLSGYEIRVQLRKADASLV